MDLGQIKPKHTLDETVECLIDLRAKGIKATCEFNGQKLDSETVTMDSAYQAVMGCTKAEYDKQVEEMIQEREKENKDALDKIPQWIERGNKIIYPERQKYSLPLLGSVSSTNMIYSDFVLVCFALFLF